MDTSRISSGITSCRAGDVFILDFDALGFEVPEMIGRRPVAVVSPKGLNDARNLVNVVPLSTSPPRRNATEIARHVVPLSKDYYWSDRGLTVFAKCDMLYAIAMTRLEHLEAYKNTRFGNNYRPVPRLNSADTKNIRIGIAHAVGLDDLLIKSEKSAFNLYLLDKFKRLLPRISRRAKVKKPH